MGDEVEVAVIGAGPAGLAAASAAARCGASVVVLDENASPGGQIWRRDVRRGHAPAARRAIARLTNAGARVEPGSAVVDAWREADGRFALHLLRNGGSRQLRARALVLCTGARERFLPFTGWTLPCVIGVGGAQALIKSGMDVRGRRAVVAGSGPLLLAAAAGLATAGGRVVAIVEQAPVARVARFVGALWRTPALLVQAAAYRRAAASRYVMGSWVARADGRDRVERVTVTDGRRERILECDLLCTGYGLVPETRLASLLGCAIVDDAVRVDDVQRTSVPGVYAAGESTGIGGVATASMEGEVAGLASGGRMRKARDRAKALRAHRVAAARLHEAFALRDELRTLAADDTIICRCEDVPWSVLADATGFRAARLHHRVGMGACQGRVCGDALAWLAGWPPEPARPPLIATPLAALGSDAPSIETIT